MINEADNTLAILEENAEAQSRTAEQVAAAHVATGYEDEDDEETAIEEGLRELAEGKGRPLAEFVREFSARFEARYGAASNATK